MIPFDIKFELIFRSGLKALLAIHAHTNEFGLSTLK